MRTSCRLVQGITLQAYTASLAHLTSQESSESRMLCCATQLFEVLLQLQLQNKTCVESANFDTDTALQTLSWLHEHAGLAHLDVKPENMMLSHEVPDKWGNLRLLDSGMSQNCRPGVTAQSCTFAVYAALLTLSKKGLQPTTKAGPHHRLRTSVFS